VTTPAALLPHTLALQALLAAQLPAGFGVHVGSSPKSAAAPFVVLYPDPGTPEGTLGDRHRDLLIEVQATCVGTGPEQAQRVADLVRGVLLTQTPTVAGRTVQPLWQVPTGERVRPDFDLTPPLFYLPVIFQLRSEPS
jgi:hypothetical protein